LKQVKVNSEAQAGVLEINIDKDLGKYNQLQPESLDSLRTAEFLFRYQGKWHLADMTLAGI
jgi:hypothetical protein